MKLFLGLIAGVMMAQQPQKECATLEECRASVAGLKIQLLQLADLNQKCANEAFNLRLAKALTLPEDLQKKLDSFQKPKAAEPEAAAPAVKPIAAKIENKGK